MKTKIFIRYASEDEDFAKPLAESLGIEFEVWFAPYKLAVGDSLLRKISQGLRECDFGVVILSPHFFAKEWPQAELDGLFNLESEQRKVILPVWKEVGKSDVARYSPILAGRLAAQASRKVAAVVDEIKVAVGASNRMSVLTGLSAVKARFLSLDKERQHQRRAEQLSSTQEGADMARDAARDLLTRLESQLSEIQVEMSDLQLRVKRTVDSLSVRASPGVCVSIRFDNTIINSLSDAQLRVVAFRPRNPFFEEDRDPEILARKDFTPYFDSEEKVVWRLGSEKVFSTEHSKLRFYRFSCDFSKRGMDASADDPPSLAVMTSRTRPL